MRLNNLTIRHFRNITQVKIRPKSVLNVLVGDNGQGKTSLIEAIYFLSSLRSFRTGKVADLVQKGQNGFAIEGDLKNEGDLVNNLKVKVVDKSRKLELNEKAVSASRFVAKLRAVVFSPESLESIKSGPESRRELVDQAILQVSERAGAAQRDFVKVLRQRNACLRQIKDGELSSAFGMDILESIDPTFLNVAAILIEERLAFLDSIFEKIGPIIEKITGEPGTVEFRYQSSQGPWIERQNHSIKDRLHDELLTPDRRFAELTSGVTLTGPHRHDLTFLFNGNDSRIFCSQGQQRAVILAFKIAEIVYHSEAFGSYPLLLLDDVLSEFDEKKRHFLVEFLRTTEAQTFLTTTDHTHFLKGSTVFGVHAGVVTPENQTEEIKADGHQYRS